MALQAEFDALVAKWPMCDPVAEVDDAIRRTFQRREQRRAYIQRVSVLPAVVTRVIAEYAIDTCLRKCQHVYYDGIVGSLTMFGSAISFITHNASVVSHLEDRERIVLIMAIRRGFANYICRRHAWYVCEDNRLCMTTPTCEPSTYTTDIEISKLITVHLRDWPALM